MASVLAQPPSGARTEALCATVTKAAQANDVDGLRSVLEPLLGNEQEDPTTVNRALATLTGCKSPHAAPYEAALQLIQPRVAQFEEAEHRVRDWLAELLVAKDEYLGAAKVLAGVDLRSQRYSDAQRAERLVRIAELFLEDGDNVSAETYVTRAAAVIQEAADPRVRSRYKVSHARMLDARRKFLEAAGRYYDLSTGATMSDIEGGVAEDDLLMLLSKSVVCAILSSAGPQRARMLGVLYKDERTRSVGNGVYFPVLERMHNGRLLRPAEVRAFETTLEPHQRAAFGDGTTILERAVVEHNIVSAGLVYDNISFRELGALLEVDPFGAERVASKMIAEGRLQGSIDQVDGMLYYSRVDASKSTASTQDQQGMAHKATVSEEFDGQIAKFCDAVVGLCERVLAKYPQFASSIPAASSTSAPAAAASAAVGGAKA